MNSVLKARTEERTEVMKRVIGAILVSDDGSEGLTVMQLLDKLLDENVGFSYNHTIIEDILWEMEDKRLVVRAHDSILWNHRDSFCHRDDGMHRCACCGTGIRDVNDIGVPRCPRCP